MTTSTRRRATPTAGTPTTVPRLASAATAALALALAGCDGSGESDGSPDAPADLPAGASNGAAPEGLPPDDLPPGASPETGPSGAATTLRPDQVTIERASGSTEIIVDAWDDSTGLIAVQERFVDGLPSEVRRYAHDGAGRRVERLDERAATGESLGRVDFAYGPNGELAALEYTDAAGTLDRRLGYEFDADGRVEASTFVALADEGGAPIDGGLPIRRTEYAYAGGRLVAESIDENADGSVERTRDYAYAADGRLETVTTHDAAAGATEVESWRYEIGPCSLSWANSLFAHFCVEADVGRAPFGGSSATAGPPPGGS